MQKLREITKADEKFSSAKPKIPNEKALSCCASPSYRSIKNLLVTIKVEPVPKVIPEKKNAYGITRGDRYYATKSHVIAFAILQYGLVFLMSHTRPYFFISLRLLTSFKKILEKLP